MGDSHRMAAAVARRVVMMDQRAGSEVTCPVRHLIAVILHQSQSLLFHQREHASGLSAADLKAVDLVEALPLEVPLTVLVVGKAKFKRISNGRAM